MKIINTNKIPNFLKTQIREAFNNFLGKTPDFGIVEDRIREAFNGLIKQSFLTNVRNLKVFQDPELPDVANISFEWKPVVAKEVSIDLPKVPVWIEIKEDWHIYLDDIPKTKSLSQALFDYFNKISPEKWPTDYGFIRLECANCENHTLYADLQNIPTALSDYGTVDCPYCGTPWLTYSYGEE